MVRGLPMLKASSKVCDDCMIGKQHQEAIPKKSLWRASKQLQLVHADICGPILPKSNNGKRYVITFIDDYNRKTWAYFLSEKSEALAMFKKYKVFVEKEIEDEICCLRTDRGGEFTSLEFNNFCSMHGVNKQLTTTYTPQQNGVAERKNRTIMNMVRSMLSGKEVLKKFWPEAVNWSVYVLNRCPTLAVKDVTPEEAWSGIKPCVDHFRVFGCVAHIHVPSSQRKKLDNKSVTCVLLGMSEESKAYMLYDPISKKIVISKDIVCVEDEKWKWGRSAEEVKRDVLECEGDNEDAAVNEDEECLEDEQTDQNEETDNSSPTELSEETPLSPNQGRSRRQPAWLKDYVTSKGLSDEDERHGLVMFTSAEDPVTFEEAYKSMKWREAMDMEIGAINKNETWELTELPAGAKRIGVKWVFKTKFNERGDVDKHKARLVAKGYSQRQGIDYNEVFAPVARWDTIRTNNFSSCSSQRLVCFPAGRQKRIFAWRIN
jgi:hypothetical protein